MKKEHGSFDESHVLHQLKHYLPAQAPLKDFIHHNTLHAFQHLDFFEACRLANSSFGYKTSLSLREYKHLFAEGKIKENVLRITSFSNTLVYQKPLFFDLFGHLFKTTQYLKR